MPQLPQARLLGRIVSAVFPKKLHVELRTETLADGNVEVVPLYTIGGRLVPPELISNAARQNVLGYTVVPGNDALSVHRETGGKSQRLSKKSAASFLGQMAEQGVPLRIRSKQTPPVISVVKPELKLELNEDDSLRVTAQLVTPKGIVVEKPTNLEDLQRNDGWFIADDNLYRVDVPSTPVEAAVLTNAAPVTLNGDAVPRFLEQAQAHASRFAAIERNPRLAGLSIYGEKHENKLSVEGDKNSIHVVPSLVFHGKDDRAYQPTAEGLRAAASQEGGGYARVPEGWIHIRPEVVAAHEQAVNDVRNRIETRGDLRGEDIPKTLTTLLDAHSFSSPWAVYFSSEVKNSHRIIATPADARFSLNVIDSDGSALLELDPRYDHERFRVSHAELSEVVARDGEWIRRGNAWIKVDKDRYGQVEQAIARLGPETTATQTGVRFPASQREKVVTVFSRLGTIEHGESYAEFLAKLADFEKIEEVPLPASLRSHIALRAYQQHGYNWLAFLRKFGLNGILADDMGLGKTLQTLAAIRKEQERRRVSLPSLVICPTSVIANWKQEAAKFFQGIDVCIYAGGRRARALRELGLNGLEPSSRRNHGKPDTTNVLVITSFGVALRDQERLSRIPWLYVVVDEAHQIKNPSAKRTRAIKTINGQHKLALTGTPIQNNLDELWSLFDFVMPGYLGSRGRFRERYGKGNRVDWTAVRDGKHGLRKRVHPFVLRRLKEQVARDLPAKVLIHKPVELSPLQVKLYKEALHSSEFKNLITTVESKGVRQASAAILAIYSRLRTICNHPALALPKDNELIRAKDSGKLNALKDLMQEVTQGDHRTLIFCQSTRMLDVIQQFFKEWKITSLRLDGSTPAPARQELVDEFNRNESLSAFLISTKAGGLGLNLTGADTVIFYDHDWNPANDSQAQDRAYRLGQTRMVTVYKLVSVGTIEEKIIERQQLKQTLADEIIGSDEEGFKDLTKEQLLSLFEFREDAYAGRARN